MQRPLIDVPADRSDLADRLADGLDATGPALRVVPPGARMPSPTPDEARPGDDAPDGMPPAAVTVPEGVAVVVRTSGTTGAPRDVLLSAAALRASADATAERLGGPGAWVLALPPANIAGIQVLVRAHLAGTPVVVCEPGPFRPATFTAATDQLVTLAGSARRYTSLVPTQLHRLLDDEAGTRALLAFAAVLVGGAAVPASLLARARAAGVAVVRTYGMTETCGGCVYDGRPLDGVRIRLDGDGGVLLAGPVLADGYLGRPELTDQAFVVLPDEEGRSGASIRWLHTADLGRVGPDGRLHVLGRADDVVVTGGVKVSPGPVEQVLAALPGVREACVVGVPDEEWGQVLVALLVVGPSGPPALDEVRLVVAERLGPAAAPRRLVTVPALPHLGPGKPDRRAAAALAVGA